MKYTESFEMDKFPLNLTFVTDLIYFDGPLLSLFENKSGDSYLYYWCDVDEKFNRWIIFRLSKSKLKSYIFKKVSLKELILNPIDGFLYLVDINNCLEYKNFCFVHPCKLPELYVPESDSYYDLKAELSQESELVVLKHIIDDKEVIKILLKLLNNYNNIFYDIKNKLFDTLTTVHQKDIILEAESIGYKMKHLISGECYDKNLINDPLYSNSMNEVGNGY